MKLGALAEGEAHIQLNVSLRHQAKNPGHVSLVPDVSNATGI